MRYRCLVLDHDDTVVNSTATVHYPSFVAYMDEYFGGTDCSLQQYFELNFDPGVVAFFRDIVGLTEQQFADEQVYWDSYVQNHIPAAYPGIREILLRQRHEGGLITVVSHSLSANILRDYRANGLPEPDAVFGWEMPPETRKPAPDALFMLMERFSLRPEEMLVIDDLKPGYEMARAANVPFAAAGWANDIPTIESFMRHNCDYYFKTVSELSRFLFSD